MVSGSSLCSECATMKKSGKRSCCARGGSWFKNCGGTGDTHFDHTWLEGIRACEVVLDSNVVESALRATPHRVGGTDPSLNSTQAVQIATPQQTNINRFSNLSSGITADCEDFGGVTEFTVSRCVFLIGLYLQT